MDKNFNNRLNALDEIVTDLKEDLYWAETKIQLLKNSIMIDQLTKDSDKKPESITLGKLSPSFYKAKIHLIEKLESLRK